MYSMLCVFLGYYKPIAFLLCDKILDKIKFYGGKTCFGTWFQKLKSWMLVSFILEHSVIKYHGREHLMEQICSLHGNPDTKRVRKGLGNSIRQATNAGSPSILAQPPVGSTNSE